MDTRHIKLAAFMDEHFKVASGRVLRSLRSTARKLSVKASGRARRIASKTRQTPRVPTPPRKGRVTNIR